MEKQRHVTLASPRVATALLPTAQAVTGRSAQTPGAAESCQHQAKGQSQMSRYRAFHRDDKPADTERKPHLPDGPTLQRREHT